MDCKRQLRVVDCLLHPFSPLPNMPIASPPPIGKNLPDSVREFWPFYIGFLCKSVRSSGPIGARESSQMQAITYAHNCLRELTYMHTTAYEKQSFSNPLRDSPPAPQEQSFALTRRRHSKQQLPLSEPVKLSDILSESFPPKEALFPEKCIKIALFPCARLDLCRAGRAHRCIHTQHVLEQSDYLHGRQSTSWYLFDSLR